MPVTCRLILMMTVMCLAAIPPARAVRAAEVARGEKGMVVAGHPAAAEAGIAILQQGGTAIDAAVATALTLGVAEPWASGLGGKLIMLYYDAAAQQVFAVEAIDQASQTLDVEAFAAASSAQRKAGPRSIAVPGLLAGWDAAHDRWGVLPWRDVVQPAIDAATQGVMIDRYDVHAVRSAADDLRTGGGYDIYVPGSEPLSPGDIVRYPDLARTLKMIRDEGAAALYGGPLGRKIASAVAEEGGAMSPQDFIDYRPHIRPAPSVSFRGRRVYSGIPPATGGSTVLLTLSALDRMPLPPTDDPVTALDRRLRVLHEVYPIVRNDIGNGPDAIDDVMHQLRESRVEDLARAAAELELEPVPRVPPVPADPSASIGPRTSSQILADMPFAERSSCTAHFVVADAAGNIVCATQSLGHHFGSGVVIPGTGIVMNNSMNNFTLRGEDAPNGAAPGRRTRSTMAPVIVVDGDTPYLALGAPGGQRIQTAVLQVLLSILDEDAPPAEAVDRPRIHLRDRAGNGQVRRQVHLEEGSDPELPAQLAGRGWEATVMDGVVMYFGGVSLIARTVEGQWLGVADDRRTNAARGW